MQEHFAPSIDQLRELESQLDSLLEDSARINRLLTAAYGMQDQRAIRAGELNAAVQRLITELERGSKAQTA